MFVQKFVEYPARNLHIFDVSDEITISDYKHPIYKFRVSYPVITDGKRKRKYKGFKTRAVAKRWINDESANVKSAGLELGGLNEPEKRAMSRWRQFLKTVPDGVTMPAIDAIIAEQIHKLEINLNSSDISSAIKSLLHLKEIEQSMSKRYVDDIASKLRPFEAHFGSDTILSTITVSDLNDFLGELDLAHRTKMHIRRVIGTLYNFAITKEWVIENPIPRCNKYKVGDTEIHSLTAEQMAQVLDHITHPELKVGVLMQGFCGVRSSEFLRLEWEAVTDDHIDIKLGKMGKRLIDLPDEAKRLLKPHRRGAGIIWSGGERAYYDSIRAIWNTLGIENSNNILRHTFCTMHVACFRSLGDTALLAGNSEAVITKHYKKPAKQKDAEAYFRI